MIIKKTLSTNSGMWGIWDYDTFKHIDDYNKWADLFEEDAGIIMCIKDKSFVPINIGGDGVFGFEVKLEAKLNDRESKYVLASSEKYIIKTSESLKVSGIEYIGKDVKESNCITLELTKGLYSVKVNLIDWKQEPNSVDSKGMPMPNALPDFIIELNYLKSIDFIANNNIKTFSPK